MKKTAAYYKSHPEARAKKNAYQKEYNKKPREVKNRVELNRINRDRGTYGNHDGKDASHLKGHILFEAASKNRGRREKSRLRGSKRT